MHINTIIQYTDIGLSFLFPHIVETAAHMYLTFGDFGPKDIFSLCHCNI